MSSFHASGLVQTWQFLPWMWCSMHFWPQYRNMMLTWPWIKHPIGALWTRKQKYVHLRNQAANNWSMNLNIAHISYALPFEPKLTYFRFHSSQSRQKKRSVGWTMSTHKQKTLNTVNCDLQPFRKVKRVLLLSPAVPAALSSSFSSYPFLHFQRTPLHKRREQNRRKGCQPVLIFGNDLSNPGGGCLFHLGDMFA